MHTNSAAENVSAMFSQCPSNHDSRVNIDSETLKMQVVPNKHALGIHMKAAKERREDMTETEEHCPSLPAGARPYAEPMIRHKQHDQTQTATLEEWK